MQLLLAAVAVVAAAAEAAAHTNADACCTVPIASNFPDLTGYNVLDMADCDILLLDRADTQFLGVAPPASSAAPRAK